MDNINRKITLGGLARRLVTEELLDESTVTKYLEKARVEKKPFVFYLTENKILEPLLIAEIASKNFGIPLFDLDSIDSNLMPKDIIKTELMKRHFVVPLYKRGRKLFVATADPTNQSALDEIKFYSGILTQPILVEANKLARLIDEILNIQESSIFSQLQNSELDLDINSEDDDSIAPTVALDTDDAPIVKFVHKILLDAIHKNASDIHFEPYEKIYRVRLRIDGVLYEIASPPVTLASRIAARIKVMSRLDISERRIPQDGRFKINLSSNRAMDFRVSTCPTVAGEKIVIRILDPTSASIGIDALGFEENHKKLFLKCINEPQGMVLVTGPTGSGKTVTLYTALNLLNTAEVNISTVEDPVEIHVRGINQVNINPKTGLTFSSVLRSFLRQDPDIVMIGEMRDLETAEIAVKAAQTGHLVLSTLHTNSAPETLTRLANMGLPLYNIGTTVSLIIAQRLARRLCQKCKKPVELPSEVLLEQGFLEEELAELELFQAVGCEFCTNGYKGRVGLYEMLQVTKEISDLILNNGTALDILREAKKQGMTTLRRAGLIKAKKGLTSLDEVIQVTTD